MCLTPQIYIMGYYPPVSWFLSVNRKVNSSLNQAVTLQTHYCWMVCPIIQERSLKECSQVNSPDTLHFCSSLAVNAQTKLWGGEKKKNPFFTSFICLISLSCCLVPLSSDVNVQHGFQTNTVLICSSSPCCNLPAVLF